MLAGRVASFEGEEHALAPILLGMAWFDALDGNAQAQPPDSGTGATALTRNLPMSPPKVLAVITATS
jgi:hypothetical protein